MKIENKDLQKKLNEIDEKLNIILNAVERIERTGEENSIRINSAAEFMVYKWDIEVLRKEKEKKRFEVESIDDHIKCKESLIRDSARSMHTGKYS